MLPARRTGSAKEAPGPEAFLAGYEPHVRDLAQRLRGLVAESVPGAVEVPATRRNLSMPSPSVMRTCWAATISV